MQILLITLATVAMVMFLHPILDNLGEKQTFKFHFHHSIIGVLMLAYGLIVSSNLITGLGLGIYLGHVLEEIYFLKTNALKAFFIFVTTC